MNLLYQTKEIQPDRGNTVSRRGLLTGAAAMSAATGAAAALAFQGPAPTQPDPLPDWFDEWKRNRAAYDANPTGEGPEADAAYDRMSELDEIIGSTRPTTLDGILAQIEWVRETSGNFACTCDDIISGHQHAVAALREMA